MADEDIEKRLADRRVEILTEIKRFEGVSAASWADNRKQELRQELATVDLALLQADNTKALGRDTADREAARAEQDDEAYWFRRWMTSLAIGNGGALFAILTGLLQTDSLPTMASLVTLPAGFFATGLIFAGRIPLHMWRARATRGTPEGSRRETEAASDARNSAISFVVGLTLSIIVLTGLSLSSRSKPSQTQSLPAPPPAAAAPGNSPAPQTPAA